MSQSGPRKVIAFATLLSLALILSFPVPAVCRSNGKSGEDLVTLQRYGVTFRAPRGWFASEPKNMRENIRKLDATKENVPAILATDRGSTVVATYAQHDPHTQFGVVPTINVLALPNPNKTFENFRGAIVASCTSMTSLLRNSVVKVNPTERDVGGRKSVHFSIEYDLSVADGETHRVTSAIYAIPCGDAFLQVAMVEGLPATQTNVFERFIASFAFQEP